jgi:hypothetical protein
MVLSAVLLTTPPGASAENFIIYTANQGFLSRIYVLNMDGSVDHFFEYDYFRFCDMEVVNNQLYVAEAFAPRLELVDPVTGDVEVIVDDWSLYYLYGVCYDGRYFYLDEWDMNRYSINGSYNGTAGFDEYVLGCAWDGSHMFTLDDNNLIKAWDTWSWPTITAVPELNFVPPSPDCRGLWFDGEYFWSAESKESTLGYIYKFDYDGAVIEQWLEPAFSGWGACVVDIPVTDTPSASDVGRQDLGLSLSSPFRDGIVRFSLPRESHVTLKVYNTLGQEVATLASEHLPQGEHEVSWDPQGIASGIYFCRLEANGHTETKKLLLIR